MILCINMIRNESCKFKLEIQSNQKLNGIISNANYNLKKKNFDILGKWDKTNSGGSIHESTFYKNPQYELTADKYTNSYIELCSIEGYEISFIIIFHDINSDSEISKYLILEEFNNIKFSQEILYKRVHFEINKKYIIIPFTRYSNQVIYILI